MTPGVLPPPQDLAAATFQGWGQVTTAWLGAAQRWWATILEWAYDERSYSGVNQTTAYADVGEATPLRGEFHRASDSNKALIPASAVTIGRMTDDALASGANPSTYLGPVNGSPLLVVTIKPCAAAPPGGYRGRVVDAGTGAEVAGSLYIFVATTA